MILFRKLHNIVEALDINTDGKRNVVFTDGRQKGAEMNQPVYSVGNNNLLEIFKV